MHRRLSACIVNWNTRDDLRSCLRALADNPFTRGEQEVVVVDNASADDSARMVREEFPGVRLIANAANENYARGTNQALAAATGDLLLLLNPDARVTPGALDALAAFLEERPAEAGGVAPRLVHEDGSVQASVRGFPTPAAVLWDMTGLSRVFRNSRTFGAWRHTFFDYGTRAAPAPQPMASCLLVPRRVFEAVGPMDERFPLYFNDVDWCLRAREAGFTLWYTADATVVHGYGGTTKRVRKAAVWESRRAMLRLYAKHYRGRTAAPLYRLATALITLDAWRRTGRWGESLGKDGGETTPESLHRELERAG